MEPTTNLIVHTEGWLVSHRADSALPGYLIISARKSVGDLSSMSDDTLHEIGPLLALTERSLKQTLNARRVYIGRYGHVPGRTFHFHMIPIYAWVEELFWRDTRYRALQRFAEGEGQTATDGAELTFFVWREFCERQQPPPIQGPTVLEAIQRLRETMQHCPTDADAPFSDW
ncbi:MAG: HIT family protein [Rhizobium sp.]